MLSKNLPLLCALLSILGLSPSLWAQTGRTQADPTTLLGPSSQARSGATVSSRLSADATVQNPASAVFESQYVVSGFFLGQGSSLGASVVDTKSGSIGGALFFATRDLKGDEIDSLLGNYSRKETHAGVSLMSKLNENFGFGGTVKYGYQSSYDPAVNSGKDWNFDFGIRGQFQQFGVGLLAQNLIEDFTGMHPGKVTLGGEFAPMQGLVVSINAFRAFSESVGFEIPGGEDAIGYSGGVEYFASRELRLRGGYSDNKPWLRQSWSLGLGYIEKTFGLEYAFQAPLNEGFVSTHSFMLSVML